MHIIHLINVRILFQQLPIFSFRIVSFKHFTPQPIIGSANKLAPPTLIKVISSYPQHSFGLAAHEDFLYWTDWLLKAMVRLDINRGTTRVVMNFKFIRPMGVVVVTDEEADCESPSFYWSTFLEIDR